MINRPISARTTTATSRLNSSVIVPCRTSANGRSAVEIIDGRQKRLVRFRAIAGHDADRASAPPLIHQKRFAGVAPPSISIRVTSLRSLPDRGRRACAEFSPALNTAAPDEASVFGDSPHQNLPSRGTATRWTGLVVFHLLLVSELGVPARRLAVRLPVIRPAVAVLPRMPSQFPAPGRLQSRLYAPTRRL